MYARNVVFGSQVVQFQSGGQRYIRVNASRNMVARGRKALVFVNADTGRVRVVDRDKECSTQA